MAEEIVGGILDKISREICEKPLTIGAGASDEDTAPKRAKSRALSNTVSDNMQKAAPKQFPLSADIAESGPSMGQHVSEEPDLKQFMAQQNQQMMMIKTIMEEMKSVKAQVDEFCVADNQYEDVSSEEDSAETCVPENDVTSRAKGPRQDTGKAANTGSCISPAAVENKGQQETTQSIFGELSASLSLGEQKGSPVSQELAKLNTQVFQNALEEKKRQDLYDKYLVPENLPTLTAPKVNSEIWRVITPDSRSRDVKLQKIQTAVLRAAVPVSRVLDTLVENAQTPEKLCVNELVKQLVDSMLLSATATQELNSRRREVVKKDLNEDYQAICSSQNPVTNQLFGDNISDQLKVIAETNKVGSKMRNKRGSSPSAGQRSFKRRQSFLPGRTPSQRGRGRGRGSQSQSNPNHRPTDYRRAPQSTWKKNQ